MTRLLTMLTVLCSLILGGLGTAVAQDSTPSPTDAFGDYPVLTVTITNDAYQVSTTEISSGYNVLEVTNQSDNPGSAAVVGPHEGQSFDEMVGSIATPANDGSIPSFLYDAVILGGPQDIAPGNTAQVLINVPAGDWVVYGDGAQPPVQIRSTDNDGSKTDAPDSVTQLEMADFEFKGLSDDGVDGAGIWEVKNTGDQPHMLVLAGVPEGTTEDQVLSAVNAGGDATPEGDPLNPEDISPVADGVLLLSPDQTVYVPMQLQPGTYVALCFVTDPDSGKVHAMEGMTKIFVMHP